MTYITGPAGSYDGIGTTGTSAGAISQSFPAYLSPVEFISAASTGAAAIESIDLLWLPSTGASAQTLITAVATGGPTNTCHVSVAIIPTG